MGNKICNPYAINGLALMCDGCGTHLLHSGELSISEVNHGWIGVNWKQFIGFKRRGQKIDAAYLNYMAIVERKMNDEK